MSGGYSKMAAGAVDGEPLPVPSAATNLKGTLARSFSSTSHRFTTRGGGAPILIRRASSMRRSAGAGGDSLAGGYWRIHDEESVHQDPDPEAEQDEQQPKEEGMRGGRRERKKMSGVVRAWKKLFGLMV